MGIEAAIAKIFIDVAVSTGVDVLSKRAANPVIRGVARAHKVYALVSTAEGAYGALRISAYSDAARLVGQEALIKVGSRQLAQAFLSIRDTNYEVHREAERYLLTPEYAEMQNATEPLSGWLYRDQNVPVENLRGFGQPLASQASVCVSRAVRARDIAVGLVEYPEARVARRSRNWNRKINWVDRLNSELGQVLWQPVPEIGLGMRTVSDSSTYFGIFRRDDPEGYGCIAWTSGNRYYGQTRHGFPTGYGALYLKGGGVYFGRLGHGDHRLGAFISPKRDWIYYGEHKGTTPDGYGRRVGLANGVESVSALWTDGKVDIPFKTMAEIHRGCAATMDSPYVKDLRAEYEQLANNDDRKILLNDSSVVSILGSHL